MDSDAERSSPPATPAPGSSSEIGDTSDDLLDPSAGAEGQDPGKGAVEEAIEDTGADQKPTPG